MIKTKIFFSLVIIEFFALICIILHGTLSYSFINLEELHAKRSVVSHLGLTDLSIWTEARYTRHPSQTDFFSAFQDFPSSPDHFPAGSILAPAQVTSGVSK